MRFSTTPGASLARCALALALFSISAWGEPQKLGELKGVARAAVSADGSQVATWTTDGKTGLWDAVTGERKAGALDATGKAMVVSPSGKDAFVSLEDDSARLFAMDSGAARSAALEVKLRDPAFPTPVFSPDGASVLVFAVDGAAVFEVSSGKLLARLKVAVGNPEDDLDRGPSAVFTKDGGTCFVMDVKGVVSRFETKTWQLQGTPLRHPAAESAYTFGMAVSDDGQWLTTFDHPGENGPKGQLQMWNVASGKKLGTPIVAVNGISGRFLPGATRLLVTPGRGEASVRDLPSLKKSVTIRQHDDVDGPSVDLSPDGKWILSWGADRSLFLYSSATGTLKENRSFDARIAQILILPDSSGCLVVFDNTAFLLRDYYDYYVLRIRFVDMETTHSMRITEPVSQAALSPDGRRLLLQCGKDEKVRVFDASELRPVGP